MLNISTYSSLPVVKSYGRAITSFSVHSHYEVLSKVGETGYTVGRNPQTNTL